MTTALIKDIGKKFRISGELAFAEIYGNGHINDTYKAAYVRNGRQILYIHQRVNHEVFKDPIAQIENIERVTSHIRKKIAGKNGAKTLTVVYCTDDRPIYRDENGNYWRTYEFLENTMSHEVAVTPEQAYHAAKAFGRFARLVSDLPGKRLHEIIPDFHNTPKRVVALERAIAADAAGRAANAQPEIAFALKHKEDAARLLNLHAEGRIPERIVHNDTKFNNVLFDDKSREAVCVADLDTVMPGFIHYDFGDMVRTTTSFSTEDEQDLSNVVFQLSMFKALVKGYLEELGGVLNDDEIDQLAFAGKLITYEIGIRFLTDYLENDIYFKTHREHHNLDRCRTQFKLIESMDACEKEMQDAVEEYRRI